MHGPGSTVVFDLHVMFAKRDDRTGNRSTFTLREDELFFLHAAGESSVNAKDRYHRLALAVGK